MQKTHNSDQLSISEIFDAHLALIGTNIPAWADLLAEEAIVEFPYAAALGASTRFEGKSAIYNRIAESVAQMQNLMFTNVRKYPTTNPNLLWAEVHGSAVITTTGQDYQQDYVMRMEIHAGKIICYCEYWNPTPILESWGNVQNPSQS
jgi:uncharacterized protein